MKTNTFKSLSFALLIALSIISCKKDEIEEVIPDKPSTQSVDDNSDAQAEFDDILSIDEDVMNNFKSDMDKGPQGTLNDTTCAILSIDTSYNQNNAKGRITIDFGSTNCTGTDGKTRRGKIYIEYTGKYFTKDTKITTTLDSFYVNDNKIEGTKTVIRENDTVQSVTVTGAKITWLDGTTTLWESTRTRTWREGRSTLFNIFDDVYAINGSSNGTDRTGSTFTTVIVDVTLKVECWLSKVFYPVSGTITVNPSNLDFPIVVDYGDKTCDKDITISYNGIDYEHTLR